MNNSYTYTTIVLPGEHSSTKLKEFMSKMKQAFGIVITQSSAMRTKTAVTKELPHAFTEFDVSVPCANDSDWNEGTLENNKDKRLDLIGIRNLRIETCNKADPMED